MVLRADGRFIIESAEPRRALTKCISAYRGSPKNESDSMLSVLNSNQLENTCLSFSLHK